ncbi:uncharacterized protein LOC110849877 isoform X1 [Folsomia candida]|uniref:uncharacterized protein LOC110849877 isoform X1 n=1 Tax=Folsomia candida TaxID=158441 RepID=UPI000B900568|nr:uncharacterized protein LOC110849877 isoform X1 [Folsomia candida]
MERSKLLLVIATLAGGIAASITSAIFNSVSKDKISTWIFYCKSGAWPSTSTSAEFSPQFCTEYETLLNNVWGSIGIPVGQTGLIIIYIFTLISLSRKNIFILPIFRWRTSCDCFPQDFASFRFVLSYRPSPSLLIRTRYGNRSRIPSCLVPLNVAGRLLSFRQWYISVALFLSLGHHWITREKMRSKKLSKFNYVE